MVIRQRFRRQLWITWRYKPSIRLVKVRKIIKTSVRIVGSLVEIQIGNLIKTSAQCYHYTNMLGWMMTKWLKFKPLVHGVTAVR
jgi:hypothetical protein